MEGGPISWQDIKQNFDTFAIVSGLHLNLRKSVVIPSWDCRLDSTTAEWQQQVPGLENMRVAYSGTYLGYEIGPATVSKNWQGPVKNFKEAVLAWAGGAEGLHLTTLAYNIYVHCPEAVVRGPAKRPAKGLGRLGEVGDTAAVPRTSRLSPMH